MRAVPVHMLPHGMRFTRNYGSTVMNAEPESASCEAHGQPANREYDNENA